MELIFYDLSDALEVQSLWLYVLVRSYFQSPEILIQSSKHWFDD